MGSENTLKLLALLNEILNSKFLSKDFSGLGVVVYENINELKLIDLCERDNSNIVLSNADYIAKQSSYSNLCHDGFFLICESWRITHENQYILPKIPSFYNSDIIFNYPVGARYVTALLASKVNGVLCSGTIGVTKNINLFEFGQRVS